MSRLKGLLKWVGWVLEGRPVYRHNLKLTLDYLGGRLERTFGKVATRDATSAYPKEES